MQLMKIELPEPELDSLQLTPDQARLELAVGLYAGRRVTLGRAAKIAGISYTGFMHEIGRRGLCIHYTADDARHDVAMVEKLCGQRDAE
jgi:predicted HTH domain antitoxin